MPKRRVQTLRLLKIHPLLTHGVMLILLERILTPNMMSSYTNLTKMTNVCFNQLFITSKLKLRTPIIS